jgi:hypothetical protein
MYRLMSFAKRTVGNRTRPSSLEMFDDSDLWIVDLIRVENWGLDLFTKDRGFNRTGIMLIEG